MKTLKTIAKALAVLIVVCIVAFFITLYIGGRDIDAPDVSELMPPKQQTLPEDQNAFPLLLKATEAAALPEDLNVLIQYTEGVQLFDLIMPGVLAKNEKVFAMIDTALERDRCVVPPGQDPSYQGKIMRIGLLLGIRAIHARKNGQLDLATHSAVALIRMGGMMQADARDLADHMEGSRILINGLQQVSILAGTEGLSTSDLLVMADALATVKPSGPGLKRSIQYKFKSVYDQIDGFRASGKSLEQTFPETAVFPYPIRKTTWIPGYMFRENETKQRLAGLYGDAARNALLPYGEMKRYKPGEYLGLRGSRYAFMYGPNVVGRLFYAFTTPEIESYLESKCQLDGTIRATQLIVAIKRFERANGQLPDALTALVPVYMNAVPADSFDGQPFRYVPEKGIIYSVSKNLKDAGGLMEITSGEIYGKDYPKTWVADDAVFSVK